MSSTVDSEVSDLQTQINNILSNVDPAALDSLTEIVSAFQDADSNLNNAITNLSNSATTNLAAVSATLEAAIDAEEAARISDVSALSAAIDAEEAARVTDVSALSAAIDSNLTSSTNYVHANFLPLSGGHLTGALTSSSTISATGTIYGDSGLEISGGAGATTFYVENTKVGINTETPNYELTVIGSVSATADMHGNGSTSTIYGFILDGGVF